MDKKQFFIIALLTLAVVFIMRTGETKKNATASTANTSANDALTLLNADANSYAFGGKKITDQQDQENTTDRVTLGSVSDEKFRLELEIDPRGAGVYSARLANHYKEAWQARQKNKSPEQMRDYSYTVLNALPAATGGIEAMPYSTQMLIVDGKKIDLSMSNYDSSFGGYIGWEPVEVSADKTSASFRLKIYSKSDDGFQLLYTVNKTYTLKENSNSFDLDITVENNSPDVHEIGLVQFGPTGLPREGVRMDMRDTVVGSYIADQKEIAVPKKGKLTRKDAVDKEKFRLLGTNDSETEPAIWAASGNQFFGSIMYLKSDDMLSNPLDKLSAEQFVVDPASQKLSFYSLVAGSGEDASQLVVSVLEPEKIESGISRTYNFDVFCGPKGGNLFDNTPLYNQLGYRGAVTFRSCTLCLFEPLARGVMWIIENIGSAIGNYGVVIILLVCVIRLLLHPITRKSQVSMMKMKDMQPQMQAIQEKYKDDKAALQREMMQFWKTTGFTPILGCLPMFIQMPIWIALWSGLTASVVLRHQGLLPFWITDLAGPDTVWAFAEPLNIPLLGAMIGPVTGLHLLPILLTVAMFMQQKFTPSTAAPGSEQEKQQKMMMMFMPVMMLLFFYNAPSGLTLYIMASTGSGVIESWVIRKHIAQKKTEQGPEVVIATPGKAPRGSRPKKPKPPYKMG